MKPRLCSCRYHNPVEAPIHLWGHHYVCRDCALKAGVVGRRAVALYDILAKGEGFTSDELKRLASGPIMDGNAIFLPAGKLSREETLAREARILRREPA